MLLPRSTIALSSSRRVKLGMVHPPHRIHGSLLDHPPSLHSHTTTTTIACASAIVGQSQSFRVPQWLLLLHDTPLWALPLYKSVFANIIGKTFPALPLDPGGYPAPPDVRPFPTPQRTSDGFPTRCVCSILAFLPFDDTAIVTSF
jgi:hypothetical protein